MTTSTWTSRRYSTMRGIRGATDSGSLVPKLPTIGRLHKGATEERVSRSGKKYSAPIDLDYFRFTSERKEVLEAFAKAYGPQPRIVNALLPYPTAGECFQECMEEWVAGGLVHRCDGVEMTVWRDRTGYHVSPPADPQPCPYHKHPELRTKDNPGCRWVGRLYVMLPELIEAGFVGLVSLVDTSKNDTLRIKASLEDMEQRRRFEGATIRPLYYFPVVLRRVPEKVSTPNGDNGQRARRVKWLVDVEPAASWVRGQLEAARQELEVELLPPGPAQAPDWPDANHPNGVEEAGPVTVEGEAEEVPVEEDAPGFAEGEPPSDEPPLDAPAPSAREEQARALWGRVWTAARKTGWKGSNRGLLEKMGYSGLLQLLDFAADRGEDEVFGQMLDVVRPWPEEVIAKALEGGRWPDRASVLSALRQSGFLRSAEPDELLDWLSSVAREQQQAGQLELPLEVANG